MKPSPSATIVILTKNAGKYIDETLQAISRQQCDFPFEVVAMDSGSRDQTLDILAEYPVRVVCIPSDSFNHGDTRNLGFKEASPGSEFVVLLTQDATPHNDQWLQNLVQPLLEDSQVAGSFSRHLPRADAPASVARQLVVMTQTGGQERLVKQKPASNEEYEKNKFFYIWFSNTSSAIRKEVWTRHPFRRVDFAEDAVWADTVLRAGYKLVFEPSSLVIHSHSYSLVEQFRQNVDHSCAMYRLFRPKEYRDLKTWFKLFAGIPLHSWRDSKFALRSPYFRHNPLGRKVSGILRSPFWHFATIGGGFVGAYLDVLPQSLAGVFSRQERIRRL